MIIGIEFESIKSNVSLKVSIFSWKDWNWNLNWTEKTLSSWIEQKYQYQKNWTKRTEPEELKQKNRFEQIGTEPKEPWKHKNGTNNEQTIQASANIDEPVEPKWTEPIHIETRTKKC